MRSGLVALVVLLTCTGRSAAAAPLAGVWVPVPVHDVAWGKKESILHVAPLPPPVQAAVREAAGRDVAIGYAYQHYFLFADDFSLWTWGGRFVLFQGNEYWPVTGAELAGMLGKEQADALRVPLRYTFPPGLFGVLAVVAALAVFVWRMEAPNRRVQALGSDPRYRQALALYTQALAGNEDPSRDEQQQALNTAVAWLQQTHGIEAAAARTGLRQLMAAMDKERSYELRHMALALEQGGMYEGAIRHFRQAAALREEWDREDHAFLLECIRRVEQKQARSGG